MVVALPFPPTQLSAGSQERNLLEEKLPRHDPGLKMRSSNVFPVLSQTTNRSSHGMQSSAVEL